MARRRSIQHTAPKDEDVAGMSLPARYVWAYLPCYADREGRLDDKPFYLKVEILPLDNMEMDSILDELALRKHIIRYTAKDGRKYIQIRSFLKYQTPHKDEAKSKIDPPVGYVDQKQSSMMEASEGYDGAHSGPGPGPGPWSGSLVTQKENNYPPFDEKAWITTLGVWESAGPWKSENGQFEGLQGAKKLFFQKINETNWTDFIQGMDLFITQFMGKDRKYMGTLYMFIFEEKWKDVVAPIVTKQLAQQQDRLNAKWD
jgi:hypothetical protein